MSLYKAETRRLFKRRFTKLFLLGAVVVLIAVAVSIFFSNQAVGPQQIAAAKAEAQAQFERDSQQTEKDKASCEAAKGTAQANQWPPDCNQLTPPSQENYNYEWYMPPTFIFRESFPDMATTLAALLALAAFIIGASFVGAEWSSGGMMNLLLWRPQRLKVLGTKLATVLVSFTVITVVLSAIWTGIFYLIAEARGSTDTMTSGAWQSVAIMEVRGLALVLVAGAVGFGLASLGRHTAMALGATIGALIVFQFGLGVVLELAKVKFVQAYLIPAWITAWMNKEITIQDYNSCDFSSVNGCQPAELTLTWPMAGAILGGLFVVITGAAMWTMRSRDIT
ncbi:ABC transporter permease subunit [Actinoplanes sp. NPDC049596]|uniref:ABC transporter permease subunit n=1 Tax=unclassified Actinoplanes TaxID=2626549 RepID=UPI003422DA93